MRIKGPTHNTGRGVWVRTHLIKRRAQQYVSKPSEIHMRLKQYAAGLLLQRMFCGERAAGVLYNNNDDIKLNNAYNDPCEDD
jgi:hypothetical protein